MNYADAIELAKEFATDCKRQGAPARRVSLAEKQARLLVMWYEEQDQLDRFPDRIRQSDIERYLRKPVRIPTPVPTPFPEAVPRFRREVLEQFVAWLRKRHRPEKT